MLPPPPLQFLILFQFFCKRHSLEGVVLQVQLALGHDDAGLGFPLVRGAGDAGHDVVVAVCVDDDAVFAQLLLDQDDLHAC